MCSDTVINASCILKHLVVKPSYEVGTVISQASLVAQMVKNLPVMQETQI